MSNNTNGLLLNHHMTFDAIDYSTLEVDVISGDYFDSEAVECISPDTNMFETDEYSAGILSGFYSIRVYLNGSGTYGAHDPLGELEVYKDGVKVDYTGMGNANVDGELIVEYTGATASGSRFTLWFDPRSTYQLKVKSGELCSDEAPVVLDYVKFDQIHHFNPLMSWINASEETGGNLWAFDVGSDTVTGDGDTGVYKSITTNYIFKEIYFANAIPITGSNLNVSLGDTPTTDTVEFAFNKATDWSNTYTFLWFVVGSVELPMVRPL